MVFVVVEVVEVVEVVLVVEVVEVVDTPDNCHSRHNQRWCTFVKPAYLFPTENAKWTAYKKVYSEKKNTILNISL